MRPIVEFTLDFVKELLLVCLGCFAFKQGFSQVFGRHRPFCKSQDSINIPPHGWVSIEENYVRFVFVDFEAAGSLKGF